MESKFLHELSNRGMIKDITPHTKSHFNDDKQVAGYIGFDPTAPSLHVGNLVAIMMLKHFQLAGHKPLVLLGGFTGSIGDPAGKKNERKLLSNIEVNANLQSLRLQFGKFLDFDCGSNSAEFVDNKDWLSELSIEAFLRDVGKHISVNYMLAKDSVKSRLDGGISYTEFTYQLFQAYDFYHLYENRNCPIQMGGSDQWGNITGGLELIRRKSGKDAFALTTNLLTKPDGGKFGKSEEGNIWLDPTLTTPYAFYQFWINVDDTQVGELFRIFTLFSIEEIDALEQQYRDNINGLKQILAKDLTVRVHGQEVFEQVCSASELLFGNKPTADFENTEESIITEILKDLPKASFSADDYNTYNIDAVIANVYDISKSEARRMTGSGAIRINNEKISDSTLPANTFSLLKNKYLLIRKGKKYGIAEYNNFHQHKKC